ncbi:MAG TPA: hypothetical protein VMV97_02245 [Sulfuriferula sp.]|nr:hypothetical protein [Sulfuriferula sp.]
MTKNTHSLKRIIVLGGFVTFGMIMAPLSSQHFAANGFSVISSAHAAEGDGGKKSGADKGKRGSSAGTTHGSGKGQKDVMMKGQGGPSADSDSDRPIWAGVKGGKSGGGGKPSGAGSKKGDLYGDLYVVLRDANGVPLLDASGNVQVLAYVTDALGNLVPLLDNGTQVLIPRDAEGNLLTTVTIGTTTYNVVPSSVEFSRLSVGRAPTKVLSHSLTEATSSILSGTSITLDAAGRIMVDGSTIDSPLENLALYVAIMTNTLPADVKAKLPANLKAESLLAAAADKTSTISVDTLVYLNSVLGINTVVNGVTTKYYDFSSVNYDRAATWDGKTAVVLVLQPDGVTYKAETVNLYDAVFGGTDWVDTTPTGGADDFAVATDDALRVIQFIHDNEVR